WEHLRRVERGPVGCQIDAPDDTVIHSGCSLPIHHMVSCILQRRDSAARLLLHENTARNCRRSRFSRGAVRHDLFIRIPTHLLFSVVANVLISICAFVSVVLFFKSRIVLQEPVGVLQRTQASLANGTASPRQNINRAQRSLRTNARSKAEPEMAATVAQER